MDGVGGYIKCPLTSKAAALKLLVDMIINQGNWSNQSTFEVFHHSPTDSNSKIIQQALFSLPE